MTPLGVKLWYGDRIVRIERHELEARWPESPSSGVQAVAVFYAETYQRWQGDHYVTENYRVIVFGARPGRIDLRTGEHTREEGSADVYWVIDGVIGATLLPPSEAPPGAVKLGLTLTDSHYKRLITDAINDRIF
jgi:hypothetical protein